MALEGAGGSEFAELASDHIFGDVDGNVLPSVVYGDRMSDHLGKIVEERDQVLTTFFSFASFMAMILLISLSSTKGPFFTDLLILQSSG